jgi:hypothetical protein
LASACSPSRPMTTIFLISFVPPDPELGVVILTWSPGHYPMADERKY